MPQLYQPGGSKPQDIQAVKQPRQQPNPGGYSQRRLALDVCKRNQHYRTQLTAAVNKRLWQIHSVMGLIAGIGLLLIGLTGSLMVFHDELEAAIAPDMFRAQPISSARLPLDILLAGVEKGLPDHEISSWAFASEAGAVDRVYVVKHQHHERLLVTVNPHTGAILGGPLDARRTARGRVMELHYTLLGGRIEHS